MALPHASLQLPKNDPRRRCPRTGSGSSLGFWTLCELARAYQECGGAGPGKSVNDLVLVTMLQLIAVPCQLV